MKTSALFALITVGITCCATAGPGGGGGGGTSGGTSGGSAGAAAPMSPATTTTVQPTTPATTSQQIIQRNQIPSQATASNAFSPAVTNSQNTNEFGNANEEEEEREHREHRDRDRDRDRDRTNDLSNTGTNQFNNVVFTDQAVTSADQSLLVTLRQEVQTQLRATSTGPTPVHFFIDNGAVTLLGTVTSTAESQRILQLAQQTTGVTQVVNRLRVGAPGQYPPYANANNNTTQTGTAQTGITGTQTGTQITGTQSSTIGGTTSDHAFSASDRQLLLKVQQEATQQTGLTRANGMQLPVHFSIQNGVVSITGQVASPQQKAMISAAVQNVPGVARVVNDITVSAQTHTTTTRTTTANPAVNNQLAPTSTTGQSNAIFQNSTNGSE